MPPKPLQVPAAGGEGKGKGKGKGKDKGKGKGKGKVTEDGLRTPYNREE